MNAGPPQSPTCYVATGFGWETTKNPRGSERISFQSCGGNYTRDKRGEIAKAANHLTALATSGNLCLTQLQSCAGLFVQSCPGEAIPTRPIPTASAANANATHNARFMGSPFHRGTRDVVAG